MYRLSAEAQLIEHADACIDRYSRQLAQGLAACMKYAGVLCDRGGCMASSPVEPVLGEVRTAKEREASWWARRRGCSARGTVRMCSFWISSMLPIVMAPSLASARLSGKLLLLKLVMKFT